MLVHGVQTLLTLTLQPVLVHGFTKKIQATPVKEIVTTERRKKDHEARKKK
jgi:phage-related protein